MCCLFCRLLRSCLVLLLSLLGRLELCLPRAVGVPVESALNAVRRMCPCGAHATHVAVLGVDITCTVFETRSDDSGIHRGTYHMLESSHCNTLQHTATHCNTLQHTATHCNTLQCDSVYCTLLTARRSFKYINTLETATCSLL